jgi:hypothetical protein
MLTLDEETLKERCEKATAGLWQCDRRVGMIAVYAGPFRNCLATNEPVIARWYGYKEDDGSWTTRLEDEHNADFIAHARTDIPHLLATIEALREELAHKISLTNLSKGG